MFYLIGAQGRLGRAIAKEYSNEIVILNRSIYEKWSEVNMAKSVFEYFSNIQNVGAKIFITSGLLDPKLAQDDLIKVNFQLPKNIIDGTANLGIKVITFGTVLEDFLSIPNPYVNSKKMLSQYINEIYIEDVKPLHIQLHTLYGLGNPAPSMFLGQMLHSIKADQPFHMTFGNQLREYHHLEDEAKAIRVIEALNSCGILQLNHGKPVTLKNIAMEVFHQFGKSKLLRLGSIPEPLDENYLKILSPLGLTNNVQFRDTIPGIVSYMKECNGDIKDTL